MDSKCPSIASNTPSPSLSSSPPPQLLLLVHPEKCSHPRAPEAFLPPTSSFPHLLHPNHESLTRFHPSEQLPSFPPPSSYWKASLLVHPDKCSHPRAQEAFLRLNDAVNRLKDPAKVRCFKLFNRGKACMHACDVSKHARMHRRVCS
ncbi:unnamed protein product [Closterium sp. NIES-54]